ncbi:hypothetical protein PPACK8108_LOCUS6239 [Phakopsora pachyrhizi]|uniref:Uncharacterized protein n=1 Tax=Phakopsora pachyrhizi TaxID=170000 RepID=A0AAV0AQH9_PHAPC|nr:hypothetical protein PPACK8108_LOCUS6239 [Phakopsora pachyrhizi]
MSFKTNQIESDRFDGKSSTQLSDLISEVLLNRVDSRAGAISICGEFQSKAAECRYLGKFDLEEDEKRKQASKMEIRRSNGEAWLRSKPDTRPRINYKEWFLIPLVSQPYLGSGYSILSEPLMINKLIETLTSLIGNVIFISNSISHEDSNSLNLLMIEDSGEGIGRVNTWDDSDMSGEGLEDLILLILEETKGDRDEDLIFKLYLDTEVGSSLGRPRPACLPDPTKKRRISQTIDKELKLPKNKSSSSGLDDQQTENATEETTFFERLTFSLSLKKEREKDQRINEELEQRNQSRNCTSNGKSIKEYA